MNATSSGSSSSTGGTIAGILVTLAAAAVLAYSMTVQRYALIYEGERVPLLPKLERCRVPRIVGWLMGLLLYGVASGLKIVGFSLGSFTVLASVFTTLLVFNLFFARWLLHESITRTKVAGCCLVLLGAVISTVGAPSGVPTQFSPADIQELLDRYALTYLIAALTMIAAAISAIVFSEVRYHRCCARGAQSPAAPKPVPPRWFAAVMVFVYPGALGLDESVADCGVRAFSAMLLEGSESGVSPFGESIFWVMVCVGVGCACLTSVWLAVVYRRYETTIALPIEYGALNVCSVAAGLLFYDEGRFMKRWQLALVLSGTATVVLGIGVSLQATRQPHRENGGASSGRPPSPRPNACNRASADGPTGNPVL